MPHELKKLTPNLVVSNVERSLTFYRDVLGFQVTATVPDASPYVFASLQSGPVEIFLNAPEPAIAEYPAFEGRIDRRHAHAVHRGGGHPAGARVAQAAGRHRHAAREEVVRRHRVRVSGSRRIRHYVCRA